MTVARTSQVATEVLRTNTGVKARTGQLVAEVLRIKTDVRIRTSQLAIEVLRPNVDAIASSSTQPQIFICT